MLKPLSQHLVITLQLQNVCCLLQIFPPILPPLRYPTWGYFAQPVSTGGCLTCKSYQKARLQVSHSFICPFNPKIVLDISTCQTLHKSSGYSEEEDTKMATKDLGCSQSFIFQSTILRTLLLKVWSPRHFVKMLIIKPHSWPIESKSLLLLEPWVISVCIKHWEVLP